MARRRIQVNDALFQAEAAYHPQLPVFDFLPQEEVFAESVAPRSICRSLPPCSVPPDAANLLMGASSTTKGRWPRLNSAIGGSWRPTYNHADAFHLLGLVAH